MADPQVRFIRDCVNPALRVEREDKLAGAILALHIDASLTNASVPPPVVIVDGVRYAPETR